MSNEHKRETRYFKCWHCGYIGKETELNDSDECECGEDLCPKCNMTHFIECCIKEDDLHKFE